MLDEAEAPVGHAVEQGDVASLTLDPADVAVLLKLGSDVPQGGRKRLWRGAVATKWFAPQLLQVGRGSVHDELVVIQKVRIGCAEATRAHRAVKHLGER